MTHQNAIQLARALDDRGLMARKAAAWDRVPTLEDLTPAEAQALATLPRLASDDVDEATTPLSPLRDHVRSAHSLPVVFVLVRYPGTEYLVNREGYDYARYVARVPPAAPDADRPGGLAAAVAPTPAVHLNGTSRGALQRQKLNVIDALSNLDAALADAAPHGRDYYPLADGSAALSRALLIHEARRRTAGALLEALEEEYLALEEPPR